MQRPYLWLKAVSDYKAFYTGGPNFAYQLCVDKIPDELLSSLDLSYLGYALAAAEPNRLSTAKSFYDKFSACGFRKESYCVGYGLAEGTLHVATNTLGQISRQKELSLVGLGQMKVEKPINTKDSHILLSGGTLCPEHHVLVVNPKTKKHCSTNEIGEIWLRSHSVAQGYWNNDEQTQLIFKATLDGEEGHYLRTGDLGFIEGDQLYINGRLKDLIIINGRNIYPQDIELIVGTCHPEIKSHGIAAFGIEKNDKESVVICAEVKRTAVKRDNRDIITAIRHAVAENFEMDIADIKLVYPGHSYHTTSGKIRRTATKEAYLKNELVCLQAFEKPEFKQSIHRKKITEILCNVLKVSAVGEHQHFMDLGGTSLHAKLLQQQLQMHFGNKCLVSPTIAFDYPTLSELLTFFDNMEA